MARLAGYHSPRPQAGEGLGERVRGHMKPANSLIDQIASFPHLLEALRRAASGKRGKPGIAAFLARHENVSLRDFRITETAVCQRIQSWIAHAAHADTRRLRRTLFHGGWFDPAAEGLPALWRAAGGSWNNEAQNVRAAKRNRNEPAKRNNNNGFRLARLL